MNQKDFNFLINYLALIFIYLDLKLTYYLNLIPSTSLSVSFLQVTDLNPIKVQNYSFLISPDLINILSLISQSFIVLSIEEPLFNKFNLQIIIQLCIKEKQLL